MYKRTIESQIEEYLKSKDQKIFFIWGPRRSGKTTLLEKLSQKLSVPIFNFDLLTDAEKFIPRKEVLERLVKDQEVILIDEVQNHPESTRALKILYDVFKIKIIATGSSELRQKSKEDFDTLANRFSEHYCLPFSVFEILENTKLLEHEKDGFLKTLTEKLQIFGSYPEVYILEKNEEGKIKLLQNLFETYVLKDIVKIYDLKNQKLARDILTMVALQLGGEVSLREIGNSLSANISTVSNYIEIFIKNYILFPLPSFKTNKRRAVSENRKLFFYDLGIRNVLVRDFRELALRPDRGGVFENFIISEMLKRRMNLNLLQNFYFYREYGGAEVDLILEDYYRKYKSVEIKMSEKEKTRDVFPLSHKLFVINTKNYFEKVPLILPEK